MFDSIGAEFRRCKTLVEAVLTRPVCHAGRIVDLARAFRRKQWMYLSIPPGGAAASNQRPPLARSPER